MNFLNPEYSVLIFLSLITLITFYQGERQIKRLRSFFTYEPEGKVTRISRERYLVLAGIVFAVLALMRPAANPKEHTVDLKGRDIVFLVDVSRSMLAADLVPNRLDRIRFDIESSLGKLYGNRLGLVAFAGESVLKCPMTTDYGYFLQTLKDLSVNSVSRGGSSIGDAIRYTINHLVQEDMGTSLDIILITDGEDQNTFPVQAAAKAGEMGIRIITIGLGAPGKGALIPETEYRGEPVYSTPDANVLKKIAASSAGGWFLSVSGGSVDFGDIVNQLGDEKEAKGSDKYTSYTEYYYLFLIPAFICFLLSRLAGRSSESLFSLLQRIGSHEKN